MMSYLFMLNGVDYTSHIKVPSYSVNKEDEYEEWKDANYRNRKEFLRSRVSGSFTMHFTDPNEYLEFLASLNELKEADGTTLASLYSNKTDEVVTSKYFFTYTPANEMPYMGIKSTSGLSITVEEQ